MTPPSSFTARQERESSYFAVALWGPSGTCPDGIAASSRRHKLSHSLSDVDWRSMAVRPKRPTATMPLAERLRFERPDVELPL